MSYPIGSGDSADGRSYFAYAALCGAAANALETRAYSVLADVLIESDSAPVKNALIDAGIGEEVYGGFEDAIDEVLFIVAKNANEADEQRFYEIINSTLRRELERGINEKALLACLNRMEFKFREASGGGYPLGLIHAMGMMNSWLYDDSAAFSYMHTLDDIAELKKRIGTGYYEELVRKYLVETDHSILLTMVPEKGMLERKEVELKKKLAEYKASLTEDETEAIIASTRALREYQSAPQTEEEKNCIPTLSRSDIPRTGVPYRNEERTVGGCRAVYHDINTNGITYISMMFELGRMPREFVPYVGLLADTICGVDTDKHTYSDIDVEIKLNTGDVSFAPMTYPKKNGGYTPAMLVSAKVMPENTEYLLDMLAEVITSSKYGDKKRMAAILGEIKSIKQREIMSSGNSLAVNRAISYFDAEECFRQSFGGLDYYFFIKDLCENIDERIGEIEENLRRVSAFIFNPANLTLSLGCDETGYDQIEKLLPEFTAKIDAVLHESLGEGEDLIPTRKNEGIMIPSQVQYVARAGDMSRNGIEYDGAFNVIRTAVNVDYLYQRVRVRGGAYGCGTSFAGLRNKVAMWSYRDPNLRATDEVYKGIGEFLRTAEPDEDDMTKYIIGSFSPIERPLSPAASVSRSFTAYMTGDTTEELNERRAQMLDITLADFRKAADMFDAVCAQGYFCAVGNEKAIRDDAELFDELVSVL